MWAGLDWLIKDSIPNCLHIGMKKKEEINQERNTCLFVEWLMGWWPVQAEKDCRSFGYSENLLLLVGMEQNSKEDIHRLQCLEQYSCGSRVSLLWPDYKCNIINCALYLHSSFKQWSQRALQSMIKWGHVFHPEQSLARHLPPFPVCFVRYISVYWIGKSTAQRQS